MMIMKLRLRISDYVMYFIVCFALWWSAVEFLVFSFAFPSADLVV